MPSSDWVPDEALFASLPGGQKVIDWFGFCPVFHDGALDRLEVFGGGAALTVRTYRMTSKVDAEGFYVPDRRAAVTLQMGGVTGVKLEGDAGSIISELVIRRYVADGDQSAWETCDGPRNGDIEIGFNTEVGLYGSIYARDLAFELHPLPGGDPA